MPLTPNGKIDRKALKVAYQSKQEEIQYVPPADEVEEKLIEICQDILSVERAGMNDDFFMLGGHSLKATILIAKIYKTFNVEITLSDIFNNSMIREIATVIKQSKIKEYRTIDPVEKRTYYEVSPAQKRMFLLSRIEYIGLSYNAPQAFFIHGPLNIGKVKSCFQQLINRHEALRTSFTIYEGEVVQQIDDEVMFELEYDLINKEETNFNFIINQYIKPFDLSKGPLFRVYLLKLTEEKHLLVFDQHHIISDGVSVNILISEFCKLYNDVALTELKIQYKDFAAWQNQLMNTEHLKKQEEYWLQVFSKKIQPVSLPYDYSRPTHQSYEGDKVTFKISRDQSKQLYKLSKQTGTTMYMLMFAAFNVLLAKYSAQDDIVVGSPIAGRQHPEVEDIIGVFINILCMRNNPKFDQKFVDFLQEVKTNTLQAFENQDYQFEDLVNKLHLPRDLSRNPIFDVMFVLQNMNQEVIEIDNLKFIPYEFEQKTTQCDLKLEIVEAEEEFICTFEYCTRLFKEETIHGFANHFLEIIGQVINNPNINLVDITMLTTSEEAFLQQMNDTWLDIPLDMTVHQLFEEQVKKNPHLIAVTDEEGSLTYEELNKRANQLAHQLQNIDLRHNEPIGLVTGKNMNTVIGILGILKAGAAYVPIDPIYPTSRISYILEHSRLRIIVGDGTFDQAVNVETVINLSEEKTELKEHHTFKGRYYTYKEVKDQPTSNLDTSVSGDDTMYMIYTSGSTGLPKGVIVNHSNVVNFILWGIQKFGITSEDNLMQVTSNSFDISVFEIFGSLLSSATLHIVSKNELTNPKMLIDFLQRKQISIWHSVPTLMAQVQTMLSNPLEKVRLVMLGGEAWSINLAKQVKETFVNAEIYNMYGPTEATIWISSYNLSQSLEEITTIPIGTPVSNNKLYIMDENQHLCGINMPGEIYISGRNVTAGYYCNQEETNKKFIRNKITGEVLYRTGDIGRYLSNGNIEFLGRFDTMVKVRGYRVELAEIEKAILELDEVNQTVVVQTKNEENQNLLCYYISSKEHNYNHIVEHLQKKIPIYMIPSRFIKLEEFPLTPNGKIDYKALPAENVSRNNDYVAPANKIEKQVAELWQKVLNLDVEIGVYDDFFELGGNSLLVIKLEVELEKHQLFKEGMNLFELNTVKKQASYIQREGEVKENNDYNEAKKKMAFMKQNEGTNILEGIEPFNDIFYKNCFYNSAFPVIRCFQRDILSFLVNDIITYSYNKTEENLPQLGVEFTPVQSIESLLKNQGIQVNTSLVNHQIVSNIIYSIDQERPVVIWIDCFYASFRSDKFECEHWPHTWLVYGYDEEERLFYIIEHKHSDNLMYEKLKVSFDELHAAYNGYIEYYSQRKDLTIPSYYEFFINDDLKEEVSPSKHLSVLSDNFQEKKYEIIDSLTQLEEFIKDFDEIALEQSLIDQSVEGLLAGMNEVINSKRVEQYRLVHLLGSNNERTLIVSEILENWEYVRRVVVKYYYSQVYKKGSFNGLTEKLRKILKLEKSYITCYDEKMKLT
ncbi:amino acid adenylation domain-containing protein [Bacillus thuringiensis]